MVNNYLVVINLVESMVMRERELVFVSFLYVEYIKAYVGSEGCFSSSILI